MKRILKPYTIIPQDLYVKRDADRQIFEILEDMGRPGYVLVSRQMGKTNLLLNAKRELESSDDVFAYVDLSNHFENEKDCFENIINTVLDASFDKLGDVKNEILNIRKHGVGLSFTQHTAELRTILRVLKGKLVIILDEIDALIRTNYSDRVFSQIRSVYFSRVNILEFQRLTYILSGVIEPKEIIKDSSISPFNIGQKIFLNDFSLSEFFDFIDKAKLKLSKEVLDSIYNWSKGNPRMLWDICAELESLSQKKNVTVEDVNLIVKEMYLISFDRPPIDNIREIVKNNHEIRNAIVEIEYGKGESVSDRIKSKLYLSGIINFNDGLIEIKNEIIRQSLGLAWLRTVEEQEKGLFRIAVELVEKEKYAEAISTFKNFLGRNPSQNEESLSYYHMGLANFRLGNFSDAIEDLVKAVFDKEDEVKLYYISNNLKALTYFYLGRIEESLQCFKETLNRTKKDELYARALVNYGAISLRSNNDMFIDDAKRIFNDIVNDVIIDKSKVEEALLNEIKAISYFNLVQIEFGATNYSAEEIYSKQEKAIELATENQKPVIILGLIPTIQDQGRKLRYLTFLVEEIICDNLAPKDFDPDQPLVFSKKNFMELFTLLYSENFADLLGKLKIKLNLLGFDSFGANVYELALFSVTYNLDFAISLFREICFNSKSPDYQVSPKLYFNSLRNLVYYTTPQKDLKYYFEYCDYFVGLDEISVSKNELDVFSNLIFFLYKNGRYDEAIKYLEKIVAIKSKIQQDSLGYFIYIHHLQLMIFDKLFDKQKTFDAAISILSLSNKTELVSKMELNEQSLIDKIRQRAELILKNPVVLKSMEILDSIARNDKVKVLYPNDTMKTMKFKHIEEDIRNGTCRILEVNDIPISKLLKKQR